MTVGTYSAGCPQSGKMGTVENTIEVTNGHVPRHDLAQVEICNVRRHRGYSGLRRFVGPEAVSLLNPPRRSSNDSQVHAVLGQIVRVPRRVVGGRVVSAPYLPVIQVECLDPFCRGWNP